MSGENVSRPFMLQVRGAEERVGLAGWCGQCRVVWAMQDGVGDVGNAGWCVQCRVVWAI